MAQRRSGRSIPGGRQSAYCGRAAPPEEAQLQRHGARDAHHRLIGGRGARRCLQPDDPPTERVVGDAVALELPDVPHQRARGHVRPQPQHILRRGWWWWWGRWHCATAKRWSGPPPHLPASARTSRNTATGPMPPQPTKSRLDGSPGTAPRRVAAVGKPCSGARFSQIVPVSAKTCTGGGAWVGGSSGGAVIQARKRRRRPLCSGATVGWARVCHPSSHCPHLSDCCVVVGTDVRGCVVLPRGSQPP
jgi:hypothetical protein